MENIEKTKLLKSVIESIKYKGVNKKLELIEEYINDTFPDTKCELNKKDDILKYCDLPFESEDFDNMFYIINQSFSLGDPYYLHNLTFVNGSKLEQLEKQVKQLIEKDYVYETEEFTLYDFSVNFFDNNELELCVKYDRYATRKAPNGRLERVGDKPMNYGEIMYIFKPQNQLLLIKTGDRKINNIAFELINKNFYPILKIDSFKLLDKDINYSGPDDAKKTTVFLLELITKYLKDDTHLILGHSKVGFKNPQASRVNTLVVGGNNLLQDVAIADQVASQATLKNLEMQLMWIYDQRNNATVKTTFAINVEGAVKIVIKEITNQYLSLDIINYIFTKMFDLLQSDIKINSPSILMHYFPHVLSARKVRENLLLDNVRSKLLKDFTLNQHKDIIDRIINELKE